MKGSISCSTRRTVTPVLPEHELRKLEPSDEQQRQKRHHEQNNQSGLGTAFLWHSPPIDPDSSTLSARRPTLAETPCNWTVKVELSDLLTVLHDSPGIQANCGFAECNRVVLETVSVRDTRQSPNVRRVAHCDRRNVPWAISRIVESGRPVRP